MFVELNKYVVSHNINQVNLFGYYLKYNEFIYHIHFNSEGFTCKKCQKGNVPFIEYKDFKNPIVKKLYKYNGEL